MSTMPFGAASTTAMMSADRMNGQTAAAANDSQNFKAFTSRPPITAPTSLPRPPMATQTAISSDSSGDRMRGLTMPTCGT